ncbi:MAG: hypothetical protein JXA46_18015 [Dehalococcoidales bacterium]|nr:hypothetical protein [Dehalococcoidales bacterium]
MNAFAENPVKTEYDDETGSYFVVWQLVIAGAGKTEYDALEDLRTAGHTGVDTLIDLELKKNN